MTNNSRLTYHEPKERFKKINMNVIMKFEPIVVGIYCKLVTLSSGKSLSIDFLSKKLSISKEKMRKTIVFLEEQGYILRSPIRDLSGHMSGWNYELFAEPVDKDKRTRAGVKDNDPNKARVKEEEKSRVKDLPCYGFSDNTETPKHNSINKDISTINIDKNKDIDKKHTDVGKKEGVDLSLFPNEEEARYENYMRENYPYIMKMDMPLTLAQATSLKQEFGEETVIEVFEAMENNKNLNKGYRSAYKTSLNWCKRRAQDFSRKGKYSKEEPTEETPTVYPDGMTKEKWTEITLWMCSECYWIAGKITPMQFDEMKRACGDSQVLRDYLVEINEYAEFHRNLDVYEEFRKRLNEREG